MIEILGGTADVVCSFYIHKRQAIWSFKLVEFADESHDVRI